MWGTLAIPTVHVSNIRVKSGSLNHSWLNSYRQLLMHPPPCNPEVPTKYHHVRAQKTTYSCSLLAGYLFLGITVNTNHEKGSKTNNYWGFYFFYNCWGLLHSDFFFVKQSAHMELA